MEQIDKELLSVLCYNLWKFILSLKSLIIFEKSYYLWKVILSLKIHITLENPFDCVLDNVDIGGTGENLLDRDWDSWTRVAYRNMW